MKTLSIFSLLMISLTLTNATTAKIKNPPKERKGEVIAAPVKFSKPIKFISSMIYNGLRVRLIRATIQNETTGQIVETGEGSEAILNVSLGDVVSGLRSTGTVINSRVLITPEVYAKEEVPVFFITRF